MKLRVTATLLNKRKLLPVALPEPQNVVGQVNKGFEFEGQEVANPFNPNLGKWYKDGDGYFYWGGGVEILATTNLSTVIKPQVISQITAETTIPQKYQGKINWGIEQLEIWRIWEEYNTRGDGVKVTVIDSGIGKNIQDLNNVSKQIYAPNDGGDVIDIDGHGTLTAGVLGGTGVSVVYGVAPACDITIIKREGNDGLIDEAFDYLALCAVEPNTDVLNLSLEMQRSNRIYDELTRIANQGTLIIAAAADGLSKLNDKKFPANHPNVVPVTALNKTGQLYFQSLFNSNTKWIIPGEMLLSCNKGGGAGFHDNTSAAAPFFSGIMALLIALRKKNRYTFTNEQLLKLLEDTATDVNFVSGTQTFNFKLPHPVVALSTLHLAT